MKQIEEILAAQAQYLMCYGRPCEEDHSLNDMNRNLIIAMNDYYGRVYVASINGGTGLLQYNPSKTIYNSACDFCVPDYDGRLDNLLRLWSERHNVNHLSEIYERIRMMGGHILLWV